jgi:putative glycosyltransferase (TIGR04372 family)
VFSACPFVVIIRLIRPIVVVRLMGVDFGRIGGAYHVDFYLNEKASGYYRGRYLDLFYFECSTGHFNRQWLRLWRRVLPVIPFVNLAAAIHRLNRRFPGHEVHCIPWGIWPTRDEYMAYATGRDSNVLDGYNRRLECTFKSGHANLSFTAAEEERGVRALQDLGISGDSFICFHSRDPAFLDTVQPDRDWRYHDYRDSTIQNYVMAAEWMADRGYRAVRTGAKVQDLIETSNPMLIDYAASGSRSDFLDIYLAGKCRFYVCSDTGLSVPAEVFMKPIVYANWTGLQRIPVFVSHGLVIFKKFYLEQEDRYMTFSEVLNLDSGGGDPRDASVKLQLIENTPEEILSVTIEMFERLSGTWTTSEEDEKLQQRFWALFGHKKVRSPDLRIGAEYLRENKALLD